MADADALLEPGVTGLPVDARSAAPPPAAAPGDESVMSLVDHLGELRTRLFRSILAVAVGSAIGFCFAAADPQLPDRAAARATAPSRSSVSVTRSSSR